MAAYIEFGEVMASGAPVYSRLPRVSEEITTTASAQTTATANSGEFATVTANGSALMVLIGSNPTALAAGGTHHRYLPDGATRDFGPLKDGDKVAAIDT